MNLILRIYFSSKDYHCFFCLGAYAVDSFDTEVKPEIAYFEKWLERKNENTIESKMLVALRLFLENPHKDIESKLPVLQVRFA